MTDCKACKKATERASGEFIGGCLGCAARAAARSPHYRRVRDAGVLDRQYRSMCEQYGVTHEQVRAQAQVDVQSLREAARR